MRRVLVTMPEFEQQMNMNFFLKLGKSAMGTPTGLNVVYKDKALLCTTGTTNILLTKN